MPAAGVSFTPAGVRAQARVHHLLFTLSSLYYGDGEPGGAWRGSVRSGWYAYDNGSGDRLVIAWRPGAVVGLVFAHESERSEYELDEDERRPLRWLRGIAGPARTLAAKTAGDFENLVTAGLWSAGEQIELSDRDGSHGMDLLAGFGLSAEEAVFGSWLELASLTEAHARLVLRLAAAPSGRLTAADTATLLELPDAIATIDLAAARAVQKELAAAGIAWTVPVAKLRALAADHERREAERIAAALGPDERALFEAARADDAAGVMALLARVAVDVRTVEGQWQYTPAGDTPLIQACKANAHAAARALIAAGADPNARNRFGQSALLWAARAGFGDVVAACLAAGGDPNLADHAGEAPLLFAAQAGDTATVDRLIAAGADIARRTRSGVTAGERASMHGHHALARLLRAP